MNNKLMLFVVFLISILSVGCVCAADMAVTDSSDIGGSLDIDDSISQDLASEPSSGERPLMELPRGYENKTGDVAVPDDEEQDNTDGPVVNKQNNTDLNITGPKIVVKIDSDNSTKTPTDNSTKTPKIGPIIDDGIKEIPEVSISSPGTFKDLQAEIDDAEEGSTLYLTRDYYGQNDICIFINKDLIINGLGHTIDCLGAENCFAFFSIFGKVTLKNLNIINGRNDKTYIGGAIYIGGLAQYTIENCMFINNWADDYGGAICNDGYRQLTIKNCLFKENTADDDDGGAIFSNGEVIIKNSIFDNNKACVDGGAVWCKNNVRVFNSTFTSNAAKGFSRQCYGGAICSEEDVFIDDCNFTSNYANDYGGAVYAKNIYINQDQIGTEAYSLKHKKPIWYQDSGFDTTTYFGENVADDNDGGALYAEGTVKLSFARFSCNHAHEDGGAVFCENIEINNTIFGGNEAIGAKLSDAEGGARFAEENVKIYENVILNYNTARDHGGAISCKDVYFYDPKVHFMSNDAETFPDYEARIITHKGISYSYEWDIRGNEHFEY